MASTATLSRILNLAAGSDLSAKQYKAVILSADGAVDVAGANASIVGFVQNLPAAGKSAEIASAAGGATAIAGGTITAGDLLKTDSAGDVVTASSGDNYCAMALSSAVDNDQFSVLVIQPTSTATNVQALTASGAVSSGIQSVELAHNTVVIAATIADFANHKGLFVAKDTSASGTASHTLTLASGTFDGTNNIATFNAPGEALAVYVDVSGNGFILANVGSVGLST